MPPQNFTLLLNFQSDITWIPDVTCGSKSQANCPAQCRDPGNPPCMDWLFTLCSSVFCRWTCESSCCERQQSLASSNDPRSCAWRRKYDAKRSRTYEPLTNAPLDTFNQSIWSFDRSFGAGMLAKDTITVGFRYSSIYTVGASTSNDCRNLALHGLIQATDNPQRHVRSGKCDAISPT